MRAHPPTPPKPSKTPTGAVSQNMRREAMNKRREPSRANPQLTIYTTLGTLWRCKAICAARSKPMRRVWPKHPMPKTLSPTGTLFSHCLISRNRNSRTKRVTSKNKKARIPSRMPRVSRNRAIPLNPPIRTSSLIAVTRAARALTGRIARTTKTRSNSKSSKTPPWLTLMISIQRRWRLQHRSKWQSSTRRSKSNRRWSSGCVACLMIPAGCCAESFVIKPCND